MFDPALLGKGHVGEHAVTGVIHAGAELGPAGAGLVGEATPGLGGGAMVGVEENLPDRGGHHSVLALWDVRQRVAHKRSSQRMCSELR